MTKTVHCHKLKKEAPGLDNPPFPGELGNKIFQSISAETWDNWLGYQTILINENRLNVLDPNTKQLLQQEMRDYLFGDKKAEMPDSYTDNSENPR